MTICQSSSLQSHIAGNAKLYRSGLLISHSIQYVKISDRDKYFILSNLVQNGKDPV